MCNSEYLWVQNDILTSSFDAMLLSRLIYWIDYLVDFQDRLLCQFSVMAMSSDLKI